MTSAKLAALAQAAVQALKTDSASVDRLRQRVRTIKSVQSGSVSLSLNGTVSCARCGAHALEKVCDCKPAA